MNKIKQLRENFGITQCELAKKLNCDRSTISKWENNEAEPRISTVLELCKIFQCTLAEVIPLHSD